MGKVIVFASSLRQGSYNQKLADAAAKFLEGRANVQVRRLNLSQYPLPLFHPQEPRPIALPSLKEQFVEACGIVVASCEYNSSFSPLLKNTIDWLSLSDEGEPPLALKAFKAKAGLILSASPGALGGLRSASSTHTLFSNLGTVMVPQMLSVPHAHTAFSEDQLIDAAHSRKLEELLIHFEQLCKLYERAAT